MLHTALNLLCTSLPLLLLPQQRSLLNSPMWNAIITLSHCTVNKEHSFVLETKTQFCTGIQTGLSRDGQTLAVPEQGCRLWACRHQPKTCEHSRAPPATTCPQTMLLPALPSNPASAQVQAQSPPCLRLALPSTALHKLRDKSGAIILLQVPTQQWQ